MNSSDTQHLYTRDYFLRQVDGFKEFSSFAGKFEQLFERHQRNYLLLGLDPHHRFLDVGCGRGELVLAHAHAGGRATGIDFSADAVNLARQKAIDLGLACEFLVGSFAELPTNRTFDRILASEFIEHVSAAEGQAFFNLAHRLLAPGGKLLVYTYPNRLQRKIGYPLSRWLVRISTGEKLPRIQPDAVGDHHRLYHLNEQSHESLRASARRAGFKRVRVFYDADRPPPRTLWGRVFAKFALRGPLRHLFLTHIVCCAEK